jgi:hypothetical protein
MGLTTSSAAPVGERLRIVQSTLASPNSIDPALKTRCLGVARRSLIAPRVDRNTVELITLSVCNAYCISSRAQFGANNTKLARQAFSLFDRNFGVFKDHSALAFEITADDEIEIEVWHLDRPQ